MPTAAATPSFYQLCHHVEQLANKPLELVVIACCLSFNIFIFSHSARSATVHLEKQLQHLQRRCLQILLILLINLLLSFLVGIKIIKTADTTLFNADHYYVQMMKEQANFSDGFLELQSVYHTCVIHWLCATYRSFHEGLALTFSKCPEKYECFLIWRKCDIYISSRWHIY